MARSVSAPNPALTLIAFLFGSACAHGGGAAELDAALATAAHDTREYRGVVRDLGVHTGEARYVYERRTALLDDGHVRASHLTYDAAGAPVVAQVAEFGPGATLRRFQSASAQTGDVGRVSVRPDGSVELSNGGDRRPRVEPDGAPVVVGPTLFSFVRAHWNALVGGASLGVRFAVPEARRTYRFTLKAVPAPAGRVVFELRADRWIVRQAVPPMRLTFTPEGTVLAYEGRVPPHRPGTRRSYDATVVYAEQVTPVHPQFPETTHAPVPGTPSPVTSLKATGTD